MSFVSLRETAPAKINLGLFVGPIRTGDGRHELVSVMQSISLCDELTLEVAPRAAGDEIICPDVSGPSSENLAARALSLFREASGWDAPALRLSILKRIPIAAGMGGGSADAAAALRLARRASGLGSEQLLLELAARLGADVPAQVAPGRWLATGAGERLRELRPPLEELGVLILPVAAELSTATVYRRADELGIRRTAPELTEIARELERAYAHGTALPPTLHTGASGRPTLLCNDLQDAAISLCPTIEPALAQALEAGADAALVSGSGPTVLGLFGGSTGSERARRAARELAADRRSASEPAAICADVRMRHNLMR